MYDAVAQEIAHRVVRQDRSAQVHHSDVSGQSGYHARKARSTPCLLDPSSLDEWHRHQNKRSDPCLQGKVLLEVHVLGIDINTMNLRHSMLRRLSVPVVCRRRRLVKGEACGSLCLNRVCHRANQLLTVKSLEREGHLHAMRI